MAKRGLPQRLARFGWGTIPTLAPARGPASPACFSSRRRCDTLKGRRPWPFSLWCGKERFTQARNEIRLSHEYMPQPGRLRWPGRDLKRLRESTSKFTQPPHTQKFGHSTIPEQGQHRNAVGWGAKQPESEHWRAFAADFGVCGAVLKC